MIQREFKVVISKKNLVAFLCFFFVIEPTLILMIFHSDYFLLGTVLAISLFSLCLVVVLATLLFYVKVNGLTIKARTRFGRQYKFSCSDIDEVICSKRSSVKYGSSFYIILITKSHKLNMEGTMVGFEKMVGYILEKYENGEIKETAISEENQKELRQYKNAEIFQKKKRKK